MRITSNAFYPYQARMTKTKQNEQTVGQTEQEQTQAAQEQANAQETTQAAAGKTLTSSEKAENLKNYFLDKYKDYGLTLSSGLTAPKHGVAPSFSIDPRAIEQAANDPQKAKELDELIYGLTTIGTNLFNAMNHPPEVKVTKTIHIKADGSSESITRREYSSPQAKAQYGGFDVNSFLDEQDELLEKHESDFDYEKAVGSDWSEKLTESLWQEHLEDKKWLRQYRNDMRMEEWVSGQQEEKYFLTGQKNQFMDIKA